MITSFHIQNFRTCRDVTLSGTTHATLLIGRNGAGKTNILSALEWVASVAVDASVPSIAPFLEGAAVSLTLKFGERTFLYSLSTHGFSSKDTQPGLTLLYNDKLLEIGARGREKLIFERVGDAIIIADGRRRKTVAVPPGLVRTFDLALSIAAGTSEWQHIKDVHDFLTGIRYYALDDLRARTFYVRQDQYTSWLQDEDDEISGGDAVIYRLIRLHQEKKEIFDEIVDILGENELNIIKDIKIGISNPSAAAKRKSSGSQVEHVAPNALNSFYTVHFFVPSAESTVLTYQGLSFGTRRILQLIVALLYDRSTVMLVEQPEDGIHPGLLGKLMRVLHSYASPTQFFMTSHSPSVVNSVPATDLRIVMNVKGKTRCRSLTTAELEDAKKFINEEGQLAEYVRLLEQ
ncbi:AAA family ATPase [Paraburkholderia madseniana]|uniref:AAA family ATPase n=1 Tax=Paraburkholderia madseniana TaxID=2599607 RepID=A0A6N6W0E7_9BURK|nr:ATP-binding protein [Paraburkholderia madseniana]KAE8753856.1 AAA family ATPase [Paraburkholderia madseniana]